MYIINFVKYIQKLLKSLIGGHHSFLFHSNWLYVVLN